MFRMLEAPRFSGTLASALAADKSTSTSSRHSATLEEQLVARGLAWRDASSTARPSLLHRSSSSGSASTTASATTAAGGSAAIEEGVLDWATFSGGAASSTIATYPIRPAFLKLMSIVSDLLGSDATSDDVHAVAWTVYLSLPPAATAGSLAPDVASRGASALSRKLQMPLSSAQYVELYDLVQQLRKWRASNGLPPVEAQPVEPASPGVRDAAAAAATAAGADVGTRLAASFLHVSSCQHEDQAAVLPLLDASRAAYLSVLTPLQQVVAAVTGSLSAASMRPASSTSAAPRAVAGLPVPAPLPEADRIDAVWLYARCVTSHGTELAPEVLGTSILDVFRKHRTAGGSIDEMALQGELFELLGDSGFEFMASLVQHATKVAAIPAAEFKRVAGVAASLATGSNAAAGAGGGRRAGVGAAAGLGQSVTVTTEEEVVAARKQQKAERRLGRQQKTLDDVQQRLAEELALCEDPHAADALIAAGFSAEYLAGERSLGLQGGARGRRDAAGGGLLSVDSIIAAAGASLHAAPKRALPAGTTEKTYPGYKEVVVPAPPPPAGGSDPSRLVQITDMHPVAQGAFKGIKCLNRLQSELFDAAYNTNENLLVCAPTGAGKTNVAMLAVCHELLQHVQANGRVSKDDFKIIYVAPMKALAQEVVAKFGERLSSLGLSVRELTGDMQLTRAEIAATQVIVTTPEKWDVITRKSTDGSLVSLVRLLIIDEVHLLADERGAVIESIVARTLRMVESSQSAIRIVGLSATLPNYQDVALFLRVNPTRGLFYFNEAYRPVPLQQTFIGVTEKHPLKRANVMNTIAFDKAVAALRREKQVMVFVHSRKDTAKTAMALVDLARKDDLLGLISPFGPEVTGEAADGGGGGAGGMAATEADDADASSLDAVSAALRSIRLAKAATGSLPARTAAPRNSGGAGSGGTAVAAIQGEGRLQLTATQWQSMQRDVERSRNVELRELFKYGLGIHHAGMLRADRLLTERMFAAGVIKILVCTATLAWGVNLPAHTVIIKGTQIYDAEAGGFNDLGMLDVMQIFGRAGRPQFDTSGEGIILTSHDKLQHYLQMLTQSLPIESSFIKALPDHLNAEIVSGTVTNVREAVSWLAYTYLFVRMLRNPLVYGFTWADLESDPMLRGKCVELVTSAAKRLDACHMVRFDPRSGNFAVTDLGRVASHYYIYHTSIETFNTVMDATPLLDDSKVLTLVCRADEFKNIRVREEEMVELEMMRARAHIKVDGDMTSTLTKVNVLLQAYISRVAPKGFTLVSDMAYITQSAGRISRALFEIFLRKGWCNMAERLLTVSKAIDKRLWWDACPLWQVAGTLLTPEIVSKLEASNVPFDEMARMEASELGSLARHPGMGGTIASAIGVLPYLDIDATVQPITRGVLRITLKVSAAFRWSDRLHGGVEPWWIWVEDTDNKQIFHSEHVLLARRHVVSGEVMELSFAIPVFEPLPPQYWVRAASDRWLGCELLLPLSFQHLILPQTVTPYTNLLNLAPVPVASLHNPAYEALYTRFTHFNPIQTQVFHDLYHSDRNVLVGAPTGSGKTVVAELATFRAFNAHPGSKVVYIAPLKALVSERIKDWRAKFGPMRKEVVELTGDVTPDLASLHRADIIITTPEKWDGISRSWQRRDYVRRVSLVVIDEIHLLGEERGPVLEVIVSRMRYIATRTARAIRFLGLSTALANAADLGDWLGVPPGSLYNFRPSVRPVPMEVHIQGFPGKAYCPRMATMNKPTYAAITTYAPDHPALVFVASRRQTRLTALEMIALCATDERPKRFLAMEEAALELLLVGVKDEALRHTLTFGVGIHHAGLCESDRTLVEDLFVNMKIRVLVCTSTLAWGVNFPARLVVIKGTEFFDAKTSRYVDFPITDVLQMMGRAGRPQFNETGVAVILVHEPKKKFYQKFLYEPFPVESQLRGALVDHINAEVSGGSIICRNDALEYLTWTYFFRRLLQNPGYYGLEDTSPAGVKEYLLALVDEVFTKLEDAGCVARSERAVEALTAERVAEATAAASKHAARHGRRAGAGRVDMESYMDAVLPPVEVDPEDTDALAVLSVVPPAAEAVAATPLGRVASFYYLFHTSMHLFATRLAPDMDTVKLARLLCASDEFAGLPVRHNEEEVNLRLAMELPWPREGLTYTSPHTKAFLLLQARLARAVLPMSDYISDTKGVLDQSVRVGHCMVDVAAELNMYAVTLRLIQLVQCIVMAVLPSKPAAAHLRGATDAAVATCLRLMGGDTQANRTSLAALQAKREADVLHALRSGDDALPPQQAAALVDHLRKLPVIDISCVVLDPVSGEAMSSVAPGADFDVRVVAHMRNTIPAHAPAPHYPRTKEWGWWLMAGLPETDAGAPVGGSVLALRRVMLRPGRVEHVLRCVAPTTPGAHHVAVHLLSDVMSGIDRMATLPVMVV